MNDSIPQTFFDVGHASLNCQVLCAVASGHTAPRLSATAVEKICNSRQVVEKIINQKTPAYGITTGVGSQKNHTVNTADVEEYNRRLIKAHGTRVPGGYWPSHIVRGALLVLLNGMAFGKSGVSHDLVQLLVNKVQADEMPDIDINGSASAADLVALAQLAEWVLDSAQAKVAKLPRAKEALSLMSSNAFSMSAGAHCINDLSAVMTGFSLAAAVTMEGFRCNLDSISEEVNAVHCRKGQAEFAARLRGHLEGSALWQKNANRLLQDPLSFRNVSQVLGAVQEVLERLTQIWDEELNSVNDNPIISSTESRAYSHGNMDTTRQALAIDAMRQGLAKVSDLAGERIHKLQWPEFSGLPIGLANDDSPIGGVQFLNLGHITASVVTSIKMLAAPHLLLSVGPIVDGVEDTSGHLMHSVQQTQRMIEECWTVISLEMIVAVWAIERRGIDLESLGRDVQVIFNLVRPLLPIAREGHEVFDLQIPIGKIRAFCTENALNFQPIS